MKKYEKITVELDLSDLDSPIYDLAQIKEVSVAYDNIGEGEVWCDAVPFKVKKVVGKKIK